MPILLCSRHPRPVFVLHLWSATSVSSTSVTFTASLQVKPVDTCHGFAEQPLAPGLGVDCLFLIQCYKGATQSSCPTLPLTYTSLDEDSLMSEDDDLNDLQDSSSSSLDGPILSNWFPNSHQYSFYLAKKTCETVCYLWFSSNSPSSHRHQLSPHSSPHAASLQFPISIHFIQFVQKVLETAQVSQSIIILSLHYIYRLKERNRSTNGPSARSESRATTAMLMMVNKYVHLLSLIPCSSDPLSTDGVCNINYLDRMV